MHGVPEAPASQERPLPLLLPLPPLLPLPLPPPLPDRQTLFLVSQEPLQQSELRLQLPPTSAQRPTPPPPPDPPLDDVASVHELDVSK